MKIKQLCILFLFTSFFIFGQKKDYPIKVFLEDAETGKNVKDAKVTLEGFEIPEIIGKYDKKGKFYYFTEIPKGYNTVMAYHQKYNEKGFQDLNRLPTELRFKLYDPLNVSYGFEKPTLSKEISYSGGKKVNYAIMPKILNEVLVNGNTISNPNFRYLYVEDHYHIAIISKYESKLFFENDSIKKLLSELSLCEFEPNENLDLKYQIDSSIGGYLISCSQGNCLTMNGVDYVYILRRKSGGKFKRFNSPEIKKLREANVTVATLTNRGMEYYVNRPYIAENYYGIKYKNYKASLKDHSYKSGRIVQAYYHSEEMENNMYYGKSDNNAIGFNTPSPDDDVKYNQFFVIPKQNESGIGLGALDNIEIDYKQRTNYFFNNNITKK